MQRGDQTNVHHPLNAFRAAPCSAAPARRSRSLSRRDDASFRRIAECPSRPFGFRLHPQRRRDGGLDPQKPPAGITLHANPQASRTHRDDMLVLTGLADRMATRSATAAAITPRAAASFLTGVHPKKTAGRRHPFRNLRRPDRRQTYVRRHPPVSLEPVLRRFPLVGSCDTAIVAPTPTRSAGADRRAAPPETNSSPRIRGLFGTEDYSLDPATRGPPGRVSQKHSRHGRDRTQKLMGDIGPSDKRKVDEYLYAIREIEKRISIAESDNRTSRPASRSPPEFLSPSPTT